MRVLVACESSGRVRQAFRDRGHIAFSCDIKPAEDGSRYHLMQDVTGVLADLSWDLVIAHPPCTRLSNSGVQWLRKRNLWGDLDEACEFFNRFIDCAPKVCIENPIQHKYARAQIFTAYDQIIQPWQYWAGEPGAGEQKATCLWLRKLPKLVPTTPNETGRHQACWLMSPGPERTAARSRTYQGIANAMAEQWG